MEINRIGKTIEYKQGHYYMSCTQWQDGHCEIEIHRCVPELLFHSCDQKDSNKAKSMFKSLAKGEKEMKLIISPNEVKPVGSLQSLIENEGKIII